MSTKANMSLVDYLTKAVANNNQDKLILLIVDPNPAYIRPRAFEDLGAAIFSFAKNRNIRLLTVLAGSEDIFDSTKSSFNQHHYQKWVRHYAHQATLFPYCAEDAMLSFKYITPKSVKRALDMIKDSGKKPIILTHLDEEFYNASPTFITDKYINKSWKLIQLLDKKYSCEQIHLDAGTCSHGLSGSGSKGKLPTSTKVTAEIDVLKSHSTWSMGKPEKHNQPIDSDVDFI